MRYSIYFVLMACSFVAGFAYSIFEDAVPTQERAPICQRIGKGTAWISKNVKVECK